MARAIRCTTPSGAGRCPTKSIIPAMPHMISSFKSYHSQSDADRRKVWEMSAIASPELEQSQMDAAEKMVGERASSM